MITEGKHEQFFQLDHTIIAHLGAGGAGSSLNFHLIQHSLFQSHVGNMPTTIAADSMAPKSVSEYQQCARTIHDRFWNCIHSHYG